MSHDRQMPEDIKGYDHERDSHLANEADFANKERRFSDELFEMLSGMNRVQAEALRETPSGADSSAAGPAPAASPALPALVQVAVTDALIAGLDRGLVMSMGVLSRESEIEVQALLLQLKVVQFNQRRKAA